MSLANGVSIMIRRPWRKFSRPATVAKSPPTSGRSPSCTRKLRPNTEGVPVVSTSLLLEECLARGDDAPRAGLLRVQRVPLGGIENHALVIDGDLRGHARRRRDRRGAGTRVAAGRRDRARGRRRGGDHRAERDADFHAGRQRGVAADLQLLAARRESRLAAVAALDDAPFDYDEWHDGLTKSPRRSSRP